MKRHIRLLLLLALLVGAPASVGACPGCRDALASHANPNGTPWDVEQGDHGAAYSYSVLFMLGIPFALFGGFGGAFWWLSRPVRPQPAATPAAAPALEPGVS